MNGKELLFAVLERRDAPRAPWVPYAGVHAGKLIGAKAKDILQDADLLYQALLEVNRLYRPDGQPVLFDMQMEAEVLGCELLWADFAPPSIDSHPLEENKEVPCDCSIPGKTDGRIPLALDVMRRMKAAVGDTTALYGLTTGPLTLASHLRGVNLFRDLRKDPEYARALIDYCVKVNLAMTGYYIEAGMDVIAPVDPMVSQISPGDFEKYLHEGYAAIFTFIRGKGAYSSFFVCGDATRNIEAMCRTNPDCIAVDENIDMGTAKAITDNFNIVLSGNIPLSSVMMYGTQQDNMKYVVDLLDGLGHRNLIVAPGCDMPYDIPVENTVAAAQAVCETEQVREMVENYESAGDEIDVELPDYARLPRPLIEAYTLDSATCAACTYMWATVREAKARFGDRIDIVEYKYTERINIARCKKAGVRKLPSIYVNGELKYSSLIPDKDELFAVIEALL